MAGISTNWVVLLEATDERGTAGLDVDALRQLMEAVGGDVTALYHPRRYALQLRVQAGTAAEAVFSAVAGWRHAISRLGLPEGDLVRAEILTAEEFARELAAEDASEHEERIAVGGDRGGLSSADDLLERAFEDSLTGLQTTELFRDRVRTALSGGAARRAQLAVFVLDLDDLGAVNRRWGHAAGDQVLVTVGERLRRAAGPDAEVARLGGDSFALLVADRGPHELEALALHVAGAVKEPIDVGSATVTVTASVGVASSSDTVDVDVLIRHAEIAMCAVKGTGGDRHQWYEPGLVADLSRLDIDVDPAPDRLGYVLLLERAALAANECPDPDDATAVVLQQVCAHTGWLAGQVLGACPERRVPGAGLWYATMPERYDAMCIPWGVGTEHTDGIVDQARSTGKPAWSTDFPADTDPARAEAARGAGIRAAYAFPVLVGSDVVAVLEFFGARAAPPDGPFLDVMASVGAQLGRVVERDLARHRLAESEARYRALYENLPVMVWRSGVDAEYNLFNDQWLAFTGRALEQELGDGWTENVHPDDRDRCVMTYLEAFARRLPFEMTYRLRRHDGAYRWILDRGGPIGEGDDFEGYVGGCIDVHDTYEAQARLRRSDARFRALVDSMGAATILLGPDGAVLEEHTGTVSLGYGAGESTGRVGFEYLHADDLSWADDEFVALMAAPGRRAPFECRVRAADGSWRWMEAVGNNQIDNVNIGAVVITATDITERKRLELALAERESHLRAAQSLAGLGSWRRDLVTGEEGWSDELYHLLGLAPGQAPAALDTLLAAVRGDDRAAVSEAVASVVDTGVPSRLMFHVTRADGQVRVAHARCAVVCDDDGRPTALVGTVQDVTGFGDA